MTITLDPDVRAYLDAVRHHLADLPSEERDELVEDLEAHLLEVAAESDEPLASRLGPPDDYAAELRASAGYPPADASLDLDTPADTSGAFLLSRHQFSAIELWWKANRRRPCAHITVADDGSVRLFDQPVALPHGETGQYPAIDRLVREPEWRQFEGVSGLPAVGFSASNLAKLSAIVKASGGKSINFGAPKEARGGMRTGAVQFIVDQPVEGLHVQGAVMPTRIGTRVARWKA